jgi:hypothetical protein
MSNGSAVTKRPGQSVSNGSLTIFGQCRYMAQYKNRSWISLISGARMHVAVSFAFLLTSCGGGGSSEPAPAPVITVPPPAPVVTVPPPAAPAPTYASAFDFSADRQFAGHYAEVTLTERNDATSPDLYVFESTRTLIAESSQSGSVDYRAAQQSLSITAGGTTTAFPREAIAHLPIGLVLNYSQSTEGLLSTFTLARPRPEYQYLTASRMTVANSPVSDTDRFFLFGSETLGSDLPSSGSTTYVATALTSAASYLAPSGLDMKGNLSLNHGSRAISGTLLASQISSVAGTTPLQANLTFSGTVTNGVARGTITSSDSAFTGSFVGRLYGPQGAEVGLVFTITRGDWSIAGLVTARKG